MGTCHNSIVVSAPIDSVWALMRPFHSMTWAPNVITSVDTVGKVADGLPGAKRILNKAFHETLISVDDDNYTIKYSIDDGPGPLSKDEVKSYIGTIMLHPVTTTNETLVVWISKYTSADDPAVGQVCNPIYQALLADLKKTIGG